MQQRRCPECCQNQPCAIHRNCCGVEGPPAWKLVVESVGTVLGSEACATRCCPDLSGTHWLVTLDRVRAHGFFADGSPEGEDRGWLQRGVVFPRDPSTGDTGLACFWPAADVTSPTTADPGPEGYFPIRMTFCGDDPCNSNFNKVALGVPLDDGIPRPVWMIFQKCDGFGESQQTKLVAVAQIEEFRLICSGFTAAHTWYAHARYETAWMSNAALQALIDDAATTPITLSLVTTPNDEYIPDCPANDTDLYPDTGFIVVPTPYGCDFPETVELSRSTAAVEEVLSGCVSPCTENIDDGPYGVLVHSGTIGGVDVDLCLAAQGFDETLASPSWLGSGMFSLSCGDKELQVRVYCGKVNEEDTERVWLVEYTNVTDSITVKVAIDVTTYSTLASTVSASIDIGCGSETVAASIDACTAPTLEECCPVTPCCDGVLVPGSLPVRRAGLFPGSGTLTYNATGAPDSGDGWFGTITGSNCTQAVGLICRDDGSGYQWKLSIGGSTYNPIDQSVTCSPFELVVPLDPWTHSSGTTEFILACTTLIIGDDDGSIDDVPSLTVTMTFTPSIGSPYVLPHVVTPTGCNAFGDTFTTSSPCGTKTIEFGLSFSASNTIGIVVIVDGTTIFTGSNTYSCDPVTATFGSAGATFCGASGNVTAAVAETP